MKRKVNEKTEIFLSSGFRHLDSVFCRHEPFSE
jgi:hypothetical protein